MLEFAVITILIIAIFVGVAWYANTSRQQRTKLLEELDRIEPELDDGEKFGSVFKQELDQQAMDNDHFDLDSEPRISLSEDAEAELTSQTAKSQINITIDDELDDSVLNVDNTPEQADIELEKEQTETPNQADLINNWDMVIAFTVIARDGGSFSGKSVKATLESLDLHFGDLQIFHRSLPGRRKQTLFSVANILDPGTLNPDSFATMQTPGLLVFARLPGPVNGLTLFDDLLDVAQKMTDKLDGTLCDESREPLSQSAIEAMRSQILNLNLQLQTEQNNYNND